jgi:hypothetical protein
VIRPSTRASLKGVSTGTIGPFSTTTFGNSVFDSRHASTARLTQSMITTRERKPLAIGV